jgi:GT2 family glycosyltransferase
MTPPLFSVLTAVHDPEPADLEECLRSVRHQPRDSGVEHVLVDDASRRQVIRDLVDHSHGRVVRRTTNGGIAVASADALAAATGEWLVLLDHDDRLAGGALAALRQAIDVNPEAAVVYSDHAVIRPDGRLAEPVYKPDFSPERLRQTNYVTHLVAVRRSVAVDVGGFREGFDGAQDHDLLLRIAARGLPFVHVPEVLYHWRQSPDSVAADPWRKPYAYEAGRRAVADQLQALGIAADVEAGEYAGIYRIRRHLARRPLVSVVIPTRGSTGRVWGRTRVFVVEAVRSLLAGSYAELEVVVVADRDTPATVLASLRRLAGDRLRVVPWEQEFNFSAKIDAGVAASTGELLLLLNDDVELIDPDSVTAMVALLCDPSPAPYGDVGAVGAKLLYADGRLQHGGHVYAYHPMHACIGFPGGHPGPQRMFAIERECIGITAAALMTPRRMFDEAGGFPEALPLHFNDVAFCLAVGDLGKRILWTPHASWYHFEGRSRTRMPTTDEWEYIDRRWHDKLHHDPYHNPNLAPRRDDWLELPGRSGAPPYYLDEHGRRRWA